MMTDDIGPCPRDTEEQAAMVLGALRCLADLVSYQARGCDVQAENLGCMLTLITEEVEKVLPIEKASKHPRAFNDDG